MKTLVIIGAARKKGHTRQMLDLFLETLGGEIDIIDAYRIENITPCKDCRYCWKKRGCSIKDNMQEVYKQIDQADNIILASPMYFHTITGPMKVIIDRLQVYWASCVRKDHVAENSKKGAVLMVGGAPTFPNQFLGGELVLKGVLGDLESDCLGVVVMPNSDEDSLATRPDVVQEIISLAQQMKEVSQR